MTLEELKPIVRKGKCGLIPNWVGNIKWDYVLGQMYFINENCILTQQELKDKLGNRNDLYYIT